MKYLFEITKHNKKVWCVRLPRSKRKIFQRRSDAVKFLTLSQELNQTNREFVSSLSNQELEDVRNALKIKPSHLSLVDCVRAIIPSANVIEISIENAIDEFITIKKTKKVTKKYINQTKRYINTTKSFNSMAEIDPYAILDSLKHLATKTQKDYIGAVKEFVEWAISRRYIAQNPFKTVHAMDLPRVVTAKSTIPSVEEIASFFKTIAIKHPQLVAKYALVAFAGLRTSEALLIDYADIDIANKQILVRAEVSKTGDDWLQTELPANLWLWLEKYPFEAFLKSRAEGIYTKENETFKFSHNALRHSFATYHLSLYRNSLKTSILLKHRSPANLWQHYLGGLTSKAVAEEYFKIAP